MSGQSGRGRHRGREAHVLAETGWCPSKWLTCAFSSQRGFNMPFSGGNRGRRHRQECCLAPFDGNGLTFPRATRFIVTRAGVVSGARNLHLRCESDSLQVYVSHPSHIGVLFSIKGLSFGSVPRLPTSILYRLMEAWSSGFCSHWETLFQTASTKLSSHTSLLKLSCTVRHVLGDLSVSVLLQIVVRLSTH